jgi:anti-anti-sigma regulatory factor
MERIPILKLGDCLLVSIQVDMHDRLAMQLQDDLTRRIATTEARGVLIDISGLEMVDSFIGRMLGSIAAMSHVLDAKTVVVGMRPAIAITLRPRLVENQIGIARCPLRARMRVIPVAVFRVEQLLHIVGAPGVVRRPVDGILLREGASTASRVGSLPAVLARK